MAMKTRSEQTALITEIYDAAVDMAAWTRLPELLGQVVGSDSAVLWIADVATGIEGVTTGLPKQALDLYTAYYHQVNPWVAAASERAVTFTATLSTDLVPEVAFRQTEFFIDFAKVFDTVNAVGGQIPIGPGRTVDIGVHRRLSARRFDVGHTAALQALFPHLQRALQIRDRLGGIDVTGLGFAALDTLAIGTVICEAGGRILFANTAAAALAARGGGVVLGGPRHGIGALLADEGRRLASLIASAARGEAGGGLSLTQRDGGRLFALVSPLPRHFGDEPGRALIILRSAAARPTVAAATLESIFELTPAEAQVALALLAGRSLVEISGDRNVSENTLRTQVAQLLRKTETTGQRDLVRLLGLLPPLR